MVKRICYKCNAVFDRKSNYDFHINRKFDCSLSKDKQTDDKEEEKCEFNPCQNMLFCAELVPKYAENSTNEQKIQNFAQNIPKFNEDNDKIDDLDDLDNLEFCCYYCNKNFSSKSTLTRHQKYNCKVKKTNDEEKENIFKLLLEKDKHHKEEVDELKKQNKLFEEQNKLLMHKIDKLINNKNNTRKSKITNNNNSINNTNNSNNTNNTINNTQNTNTSNTQNNVVMVNFGKEDLSIIDEKQFIEKIVKKNNISGVKIPDEVLKIIHFNPQYPQLSNIYISDINREKCMVYEDGEWKLSNVNNIPQIMDKVCVYSSEQISNLRTKHPNNKPLEDRLNTIEKYNNMIDGDYVDDLRDDDRQVEIARCEEFQAHAYNTLKKTLYNEGKKLRKTIKLK